MNPQFNFATPRYSNTPGLPSFAFKKSKVTCNAQNAVHTRRLSSRMGSLLVSRTTTGPKLFTHPPYRTKPVPGFDYGKRPLGQPALLDQGRTEPRFTML